MNKAIIDKIKKLLARGDINRNDNDNERDIAMRQANALLVKHGLTMQDVSDQTERGEILGKLGRLKVQCSTKNVWEAGIFNEIARLNGCTVIRMPATKGEKPLVYLLGRQMHCTTTRYLAQYCVDSIINQAKRNGHKITAFGVGAWTGIANQVTAILKQQQEGIINGEQVEKSTALLVIDQHKQALIDANRALKEFHPRARSGNYSYDKNSADRAAGTRYGSSMSLNKQVSGNNNRRLGHG